MATSAEQVTKPRDFADFYPTCTLIQVVRSLALKSLLSACSNLSLAKIDEMGRFVSEFETHPDAQKSLLSDIGESDFGQIQALRLRVNVARQNYAIIIYT